LWLITLHARKLFLPIYGLIFSELVAFNGNCRVMPTHSFARTVPEPAWRSFICHPYTCTHKRNEQYHSPAANHHRTLAGIFRPAEGRRLSWLGGRLHTEVVCTPEDDPPIPVLTGPDVEQLFWYAQRRYRYAKPRTQSPSAEAGNSKRNGSVLRSDCYSAVLYHDAVPVSRVFISRPTFTLPLCLECYNRP